ncbi:MAG: hypothetical protein SGARI_004837 [Bacillariaceae sp.]
MVTGLAAKLERNTVKSSRGDGEKSVVSRVSRSKSSNDAKDLAAALSPRPKTISRTNSFTSVDKSVSRPDDKGFENVLASPGSKGAIRQPMKQRSKHALMKEQGESALQESTRIYRAEMEEALNASFGTVQSPKEQKKRGTSPRRRSERRRTSSSKSHSPTSERRSISHRKDRRDAPRSRSQDKNARAEYSHRRENVHGARSQDLWLTKTPDPKPTKFIGAADLRRVPHSDGKTREKYQLDGAAKKLQAPLLDGSSKPSRRGTRSRPAPNKHRSSASSSRREHQSSSPSKARSAPNGSPKAK